MREARSAVLYLKPLFYFRKPPTAENCSGSAWGKASMMFLLDYGD